MFKLSTLMLLILILSAVHTFPQNSTKEKSMEYIRYLDQYYESNYFSKGKSKTEMKGTGYYPYMRWKYYYERRADENGEIPSLSRWQAYKNSKKYLFKDAALYPAADWTEVGPTNRSGRIISHAFDPTNSEIVWVGAASGGLWKTTNGGNSWMPMTDQLPSLSIGAVAIKPQDPDYMLIGTGESYGNSIIFNGVGILKSTDKGLTWYQTSFTYQLNQNVSCGALVWNPLYQEQVYAGTTIGFWRSTDQGETWVNTRSGKISSIIINKKSPNIIYSSIQGQGIFKSTDCGVSWTKMTTGLPSSGLIGHTSLAICDSFPNILYAGIAKNDYSGQLQGFYKSNNGGDSWRLIPTPDFYCHLPPYQTICQGWYDNVTAVSPVDSDFVFANGIELYRSTDGGNSWDNPAGVEPYAITYVDHHSFGFDPMNVNTLYAFDDAGVYKSTDAGDTWAEKANGFGTMQFYNISSSRSNPGIIIGGSQDVGTYFVDHSSGSTVWNLLMYADGGYSNIDYDNPDIMYGEYQFGQHYKTVDGGNNVFMIMNGITESGPFVTPVIMDPFNSSVLYTAGDTKIFKTTNGGSRWNVAASIPNCQNLETDKVNPAIVYAYAFTYSGGYELWKSTNAGSEWTQITPPGWRVTDIEASPVETGVLYATQNAFNGVSHVYKSTDFGSHWMDITSNLPAYGCNAITVNPYNKQHLYVATDLGVFASVDGGIEWFEYNDGLPNVPVNDIHIHPADTTLRVGTYGRGVWKTKAIDITVTAIETGLVQNNKLSDFTLFPNFPNPFNGSTTLSYELRKAGSVSINIYNELGQLVNRLYNGKQVSGKHTIQWDGKNIYGQDVASGTYIFRITMNGLFRSGKMILLK